MPLTVVVGSCGTNFRPPVKALNADICLDAACLEVAPNVCFTVHQFFVTPVERLVLDRCSQNLTTTIFVWATELVLLKNVLPLANVVYQDDMCSRKRCLALATTERWRRAWLPLCDRCSAEVDEKKA